MEEKKVNSKLIENLSFRIFLCYFTTLNQSLEIRDPANSLLFDYSEIDKILNSNDIESQNLSKFIYYNKNNIHNMLFDYEERINIDSNHQSTAISFLFYLSLLIRENPDIFFYNYSFDYIKDINNIVENRNNPYAKIVIASILLDLIENYKNKDDFISESRNIEELKQIQRRNENIIREMKI